MHGKWGGGELDDVTIFDPRAIHGRVWGRPGDIDNLWSRVPACGATRLSPALSAPIFATQTSELTNKNRPFSLGGGGYHKLSVIHQSRGNAVRHTVRCGSGREVSE